MTIRYFALILGMAFLLVGIAGFIPALLEPGPSTGPHLMVHGPGEGYLFGLFHVNILHNAVHLLFGAWGILAFATLSASRIFARVVAISYGVLVLFGLCPIEYVNTLWGLIPVHGHDVWLHAVIALASAYFGWAKVPVATTVVPEIRM